VRPSLLLLSAALLFALPAPRALAEDQPASSPPRPQAAGQRAPSRAYHLTPGLGGLDCNLRIGPRDRLAQDADLVVPAGAVVEAALALRGSVIVGRGARVSKAVAAGGSVVVEDGAVVEEDAVALSGDVRVEPGGRVGGQAVSLGGQVLIRKGGQVKGDVLGLSLQLFGTSLAQGILDGLVEKGPCRVEVADESATR
jgi:hypothetical protein